MMIPGIAAQRRRGASVPVNDPYFANVTLLLHGNGADGYGVFTDSSPDARVITRNGAYISTARSKFGGASMFFDGLNDYIQTTHDDEFSWASTDFTLEYFFFNIAQSNMTHFAHASPTTEAVYWSFGTNMDGRMQLYYWTGATHSGIGSDVMALGQWHHAALTVSGDTIRIFANGLLQATATRVTPATPVAGYPIIIGSRNVSYPGSTPTYVGVKSHYGHIDEVRVTKGVARYVANFTPPTAPFPNS